MTQRLSYNSTDSPDKPLSRLESEAEPMQLARQGDGSAFAPLFHYYNAPIYAYLARLVGNDELGQDLAQETFLQAWKSLLGLSSEQRFRPLLAVN
jgi:DNA-directed RNA polymerase specialized sigma24 family protein